MTQSILSKTNIRKDADNKRLIVERNFDAPVDLVWRAWTEKEILDQWWAPKPWRTKTKSMDFREGGSWFYSMIGPEGEESFCRADYDTIDKNRSFTGYDAFCDAEGNINTEFPRMHWDVQFKPDGDGTLVKVVVSFDSEEDMNKIVEMGFQEGFAMAHTNLDELLAGMK